MATLTWAAQRLNADRVLVGEVRGPEVIPAIMIMALGNDGSLFTVHAPSSDAALRKCQSYASIAPERWSHEESAWMIRDAVHAVVHVDYDRSANRRYVASIRVITGIQGRQLLTDEVYGRTDDGTLAPTGAGLDDELSEELHRVGFAADERGAA
ncbi:MAG: pilus assembly protein CpaF [Actinomycetota bacterium]|jgi:Flp pilus assembly CpaF family ATPase|nr:pilus assembly protein CpaF [Actinomycetota bacterium]